MDHNQTAAPNPTEDNDHTTFNGTVVQKRFLLDYLVNGGSVEAFLGDFPAVTAEQAQAARASFVRMHLRG